MGKNKSLPLVALIGRPNVGKSTLFNRLLHKRRAITSPVPGVTRDPVEMDTVILGRPLRLVDTGGFKLDRDEETPEGELERIVVERTIEVLKKSSLVVLLLEAGEIKGEDEEFISLLRPYQKKLLVAVNKTEGGRRGDEAWNLLSYGFDKVYMISAEHGDNINLLEEVIINRLDKLSGLGSLPEGAAEQGRLQAARRGSLSEEVFPSASLPEAPIRIALLGKPNTGKSTLSNRLTSSSASIVSDIPGTTRDVIEGSFSYKKRNFFILDTAGIRRKAKVNKNIEYYSVNRAIKSIDEADIVFLIIDANEGLTDQDKKIAALAHDKGRGIILVLNKWDIMPGANEAAGGESRLGSAAPSGKRVFINVRNRIHFLFGQMEYAPIIPVSALNGNGVNKLLDTSIQMYRQLKLQIATSVLNQSLEKWLIEYPPPAGRGRFKIRYAVQTQANPVKFVFFASRLDAVSDSYVAYLRNRIRRDLGFSIIPVSIELRASSNPQDKHKEGKGAPHSRRRLADKPKKRR